MSNERSALFIYLFVFLIVDNVISVCERRMSVRTT